MAPEPEGVRLRAVETADLPLFFEHQRDALAGAMAAFTAVDPADRPAFNAHWARIRTNPAITVRTIVWAGDVAGYTVAFERFGHLEIGYWIARRCWGRGVATAAVRLLLAELPDRPLYARAASDNVASLRVLEKCGFSVCGHDTAFANARSKNVRETILIHD